MIKKAVIGIAILSVVIFGVFLAYTADSHSYDDKTTLNVSSEGPLKLSDLIKDIKTRDCYKGYDSETVKWMESLGEKYVWSSSDEFVIMNKWDSDKIPSQYVCDAYFDEIFSCDVLKKHSLGNIECPKEILLVKNVEYIGEEIHYCDV